jgi:hypothetical protein
MVVVLMRWTMIDGPPALKHRRASLSRWPMAERNDDRKTIIKVAKTHLSDCIKVGQRPTIIGHRNIDQ